MSDQTNIYLQRINLVIDHISTHLSENLSLEALAELAGFSPFHFHRIFKAITDEPLNQFVNRVRVEQAAKLLRANPSLNILDAAVMCGYDSASGFSRAFKRQFGFSPRRWNRVEALQDSKISKVLEAPSTYTVYKLREIDMIHSPEVKIHTLPKQRLAYVRVNNSYASYQRIIEAHDTLIEWYQNKGGQRYGMKLYGMSEDDPDITPPEKCRFDWCVAIPNDWQVRGGFSERIFPETQVASIHVVGDLGALARVWQYLWRCWLPTSRYQPANLPALEIYVRSPGEIGWDTYDMLCAIPIEPL